MKPDYDYVVVVCDDPATRAYYRQKYSAPKTEVEILPEWDHLKCMTLIEELYAQGRLHGAVWGTLTSPRAVHREACKKHQEYLASRSSEATQKAA